MTLFDEVVNGRRGSGMKSKDDNIWYEWIATVMAQKPQKNRWIDSKRGQQVTKLCLNFERDDYNWHRSDTDTFWLDVQMFVKYKLSDKEIRFILKQQPGVENYSKHSAERNAYAEFMRGLEKLRKINSELAYDDNHKLVEVK
ncbi:hypothetical protein [Streptococcus sp. FT1-55]|uniref:hypothetical protein n=1 Tax=Streptococcus sp. FT1-55 TaxID=3409805 RepID=UPI003BF51080